MVRDLPSHLRDLLDIATYVFVADRLAGRGGDTDRNLGAHYRRSFRFEIAVQEPERWNSPGIRSALENLLSFLSDDQYSFEFCATCEPLAPPSKLPISGPAPLLNTERIILFSGGLDSLAGVVRDLEETRERLMLVSHHSSDLHFSRQQQLVARLDQLYRGRVVHLPIEVTLKSPLMERETTQRSRSFLFYAMATVVAEMMGGSRIQFFENGVMSFHLPIAGESIGSRATRSTHPLVLRLMSEFARLALDRAFIVDNPFVWHTKAEVVKSIAALGRADLIKIAITCAENARVIGKSHCGNCTQCLQRRIAVLAAGLQAHDPGDAYVIECLTGERPRPHLALHLVSSALGYESMSLAGFKVRYSGEIARAARGFPEIGPDDVFEKAFDLHRRFGREVANVMDTGTALHARALRERTLPSNCLLRLMLKEEGAASISASVGTDTQYAPSPTPPSPIIELAVDNRRRRVRVYGLGVVGTARHFDLLNALVSQHRLDKQRGFRRDHHTFITSEDLADHLKQTAVGSVAQLVKRFRDSASELALSRWGFPLAQDSIVETGPNGGFRLNPEVNVIAPEEMD